MNAYGDDVHNFHFRKPVQTDRGKAIEYIKSTGRNQFSMKVMPGI
jgi:hypothetical protein